MAKKQNKKRDTRFNHTDQTYQETRNTQGYPTLLLLCILVIETLATKIRQDTGIRGIKVDNLEFKMKSYANDVVLTVLDL